MLNEQDSSMLANQVILQSANYYAAMEQALTAPSAVYRPALTQDGDQFVALYGPNLAVGVAGFGDTPAAAMRAFDLAWYEKANRPAATTTKATV